MASFFKPDVPQQDPAVAKQQQDEQARADAARIRETQDQLQTESLLRSRRLGVRSLAGSFTAGRTSLLGTG
ncbi:hypothetical protein CQ12_13860 [Bradyrhizobium jicamae]|uniref:Uncharacterized protein n=1 Tax=Bradyrhizobium jicamae TaxID=280332 RepID=A0A0R3LXT8_9BRAD|nr:hypothetical protein [Bradyrhizobium jicamae]KRR09568.1 hypothetical protein CQ12_13860 [Bradyrhizobium jicamae]